MGDIKITQKMANLHNALQRLQEICSEALDRKNYLVDATRVCLHFYYVGHKSLIFCLHLAKCKQTLFNVLSFLLNYFGKR